MKFIFDTSKPVSDRISARLQRWAYVLRSFDFSVENVTGENMHLPDTLSRLAIPDDILEISDVDMFMHEHHKNTPFLQAIRSSSDPELKQLKSFILNDWPRYIKPALQPYNRDRLTYCVHDGAVYKDYRLVVPSSFRSQILQQLHEGHIGIGRMRSKAREIYWWPAIDRDIANFVSRCVLSQGTQYSEERRPSELERDDLSDGACARGRLSSSREAVHGDHRLFFQIRQCGENLNCFCFAMYFCV